MSLLSEVGTYLAANGIGTLGIDLFQGYMPDSPDAATAIYETGGLGPVRGMRSTAGTPAGTQPRLQVVSRAGEYDYSTARAKVQSVYALLEGLGDVTLSGVAYKWFGAVQEPFMMGRDDSRRVLIAQNFDVIKDIS